MGGICCAGEPFQIGKPWAKEDPWAHFSYKRDSWLAVAAVNALPQLMALIAENERLKTLRSTTERDLAQELEVWRHGPSCWNCGDTGDVHDIVGEWRGQCDCNAAKLINVASERDQLKAENETLIAAAQALRDEWRKDQADAERYRWLRVKQTFIWLIQDWFPKNNVLTDVDAEIDAAMGKGVQS